MDNEPGLDSSDASVATLDDEPFVAVDSSESLRDFFDVPLTRGTSVLSEVSSTVRLILFECRTNDRREVSEENDDLLVDVGVWLAVSDESDAYPFDVDETCGDDDEVGLLLKVTLRISSVISQRQRRLS